MAEFRTRTEIREGYPTELRIQRLEEDADKADGTMLSFGERLDRISGLLIANLLALVVGIITAIIVARTVAG